MVKIPDSNTQATQSRPNWLQRQSWHTVRLLQLAFGLFCMGDFFFYSGEWAVLALGGFVLLQGIFDWQLGCAAGRPCARRP